MESPAGQGVGSRAHAPRWPGQEPDRLADLLPRLAEAPEAALKHGLRVSEATGANIEALGVERGHRTLVITREGGKVVTIPLAPRTARAIDLAVGERSATDQSS